MANFVARTIDDKITKDCLAALPEDLYVIGGMAVQTYLKNAFSAGNIKNIPELNLRPTSDIDIETTKKMSFDEFNNCVVEKINRNLPDNYETKSRKGRWIYELLVTASNGEKILVHGKKYTNKKFNEKETVLQRELDHTQKLDLGDISFKVSSPEDIVVNKLDRILWNTSNYNISPSLLPLPQLNREKENLYEWFDQSTTEDLKSLKTNNDLSDLSQIDKVIRLDSKYLKLVVDDHPELKNDLNTNPKSKVLPIVPAGIIKKIKSQ